jgi:hypothetical protein
LSAPPIQRPQTASGARMGERTWCDGCGPLSSGRDDDVLCESCWGDAAAEATGRERARIVALLREEAAQGHPARSLTEAWSAAMEYAASSIEGGEE